jgi:hypothetical protein
MLRKAQRDDQVGKKLHHQTHLKLMSTRTQWMRPRRKPTRSDHHLVYCKSPCDTRVLYEMLSCEALPFHMKLKLCSMFGHQRDAAYVDIYRRKRKSYSNG